MLTQNETRTCVLLKKKEKKKNNKKSNDVNKKGNQEKQEKQEKKKQMYTTTSRMFISYLNERRSGGRVMVVGEDVTEVAGLAGALPTEVRS